MAAAITLGYFVGAWFDGALEMAPWGTVLWLAAGFGAAIKALVRAAKSARRQLRDAPDAPHVRRLVRYGRGGA